MTTLILCVVIAALIPPAIVGAVASALLYKVLQAARKARLENIASKKPRAASK